MPDHTPRSSSEAQLDEWERAFADGLVVSSRHEPMPWLAGHVHVAQDLPAQQEPVQTGRLDAHQVLVFDAPSVVREVTPSQPPLYDGPVDTGMVGILPREVTAEENYTSWSDRFGFMSVMLPPATVAAACRTLDVNYAHLEFLKRYGHHDPLLEHLVRRLGHELLQGGAGGRLYAEQLMQTMALHLVQHHSTAERTARVYTGGLPSARLRRVKNYVEAHLADDIALDDLADEARMSAHHFCRMFKQSVGRSPYQYVIARRIERARDLLRHTDQPLAQIALVVGYNSQSHFTAQFKQHVGTTPGAFRDGL